MPDYTNNLKETVTLPATTAKPAAYGAFALAVSGQGSILPTSALGSNSPSLTGRFGGDGSDGELVVTTGTTTIDLGSATSVVKNYSRIFIASGATLDFSNPASGGTVIIFKSLGKVSILGTIDVRGVGSAMGQI